MTKLTPEACRAARAILGLTMQQLAARIGVSPATINSLERGGPLRPSSEVKILDGLADLSIEVLNGDAPGARVRRPYSKLLKSGAYTVSVPILGRALPHELPNEFPTEEAASAWLQSEEGRDLVRRVRAKFEAGAE